MREHVRADREQVVVVPALHVSVHGAVARIGAHDGAAGIVRRLVGHDRPRLGAGRGFVEVRRVHGLGERVDHIGGVAAHLVLVLLVVERHTHQRQAERIAIGRVEIVVVVAVRHDAAARADVHGGLVPLRGGSLPRLAPLRRAAWHRPVTDRQRRIEARTHVIAAHEAVRPAIEVPVDVEVVNGPVRTARAHEWIEAAPFEEERGSRAGLVAVVLADDAFLRDRVVGLADA